MSDGTHVRPGDWRFGALLSHDELTPQPPRGPGQPKGGPPPEPEQKPEPEPETPPKPEKAPTVGVPETTTDVSKEDADDAEDKTGDHDADEESVPWWRRKPSMFKRDADDDGDETDDEPENTTTEPAEPATAPTAPQESPDQTAEKAAEGWLRALAKSAGQAKVSDTYKRRRIQAAKWAVGAAIGWGFGLTSYVRQAMDFSHADPGAVAFGGFFAAGAYTVWKILGGAQHWLQPAFHAMGEILESLVSVCRIVPLLGPVVGLVTTPFHALLTHYVPFRAMSAAFGGWLAAPWGFVAVGYAQSHGVDTTELAPWLVSLGGASIAWWFIDRRTEAWCQKGWPGHIGHWAAHVGSGTFMAATGLYLIPS